MSYTIYSFLDRSSADEKQWAERTVEGEIRSSHTRTLVKVFRNFLKEPNLKVLEAGCGLGGWLPFFQDMGHHIVGVEYMPDIVERVKAYDASLPIVQGDVSRLDFADSSFDAYISLGVIEHFQEGPQQALAEARRVLRPGGLAFVTVPYLNLFRRICVHPLRAIYFRIRRIQGKEDYFWEYRYTKKEMSRFLREAGFEIIYTGIDDYIAEDKKHHIGLYADFFFLRKKGGEVWELNALGQMLLKIGRFVSPWFFCSGLHMVARNEKHENE